MSTNPIYGFLWGVKKGERYSRGKLKDNRPQRQKTKNIHWDTKGIYTEVSNRCRLRSQ